jgi:hypothetical protein
METIQKMVVRRDPKNSDFQNRRMVPNLWVQIWVWKKRPLQKLPKQSTTTCRPWEGWHGTRARRKSLASTPFLRPYIRIWIYLKHNFKNILLSSTYSNEWRRKAKNNKTTIYPYSCLRITYFKLNECIFAAPYAKGLGQIAIYGPCYMHSLAIISSGFSTGVDYCGRSQWPRGPKNELPSLALPLRSWVRIPLKAWISVCAFILCLCCSVCT